MMVGSGVFLGGGLHCGCESRVRGGVIFLDWLWGRVLRGFRFGSGLRLGFRCSRWRYQHRVVRVFEERVGALRRLENIAFADILTGERINAADFTERRFQIAALGLWDAVDQLIQVFRAVREGALLEGLIKIGGGVWHGWRNNNAQIFDLSRFSRIFLDIRSQ